MDAPQDLDTAHPVSDEPAPLVKVQRWYHLRRLFVFDFGWHTKDFRLISITETEPGEFSCTFKPRYFPYRMFLPIQFTPRSRRSMSFLLHTSGLRPQ